MEAHADEGQSILLQAHVLEHGKRRWQDRQQTVEVTVTTATGTNTRKLRVYERRESVRSRKALVRFLEPSELRGTGLLVHTGSELSQWLFLPTGNRLIPLGPTERKGHLAGSDLTYGDFALVTELPGWGLADATSRFVHRESVDGVPCNVIELTPVRKNLPYATIRVWLGADDSVARRLDLQDGAGGVVKRIRLTDIHKVGSIPVPYITMVETLGDGTRSEFAVQEIVFDVGLPDACFTPAVLESPGEEARRCAAGAAEAPAPTTTLAPAAPGQALGVFARLWEWLVRVWRSLW